MECSSEIFHQTISFCLHNSEFFLNYIKEYWNIHYSHYLYLYYIFVGGLPSDPRTWSRDDVGQFLQYCEREFDLEKIDMEKFQMNGKVTYFCFIPML